MSPGNDEALREQGQAHSEQQPAHDTAALAAAQAGKWLALVLYHCDIRSLGETQAAFDHHPELAPA